MADNLFDTFEPVSSKQWKQQIQYELKGADYNDTLVWESLEGIKVRPFYHNDETEIKYDFINGAKALFNRWFGLNLKTKKVYNRDICSMFVLPYALDLEMVCPLNDMNDLFFPQDYYRQINKANIVN